MIRGEQPRPPDLKAQEAAPRPQQISRRSCSGLDAKFPRWGTSRAKRILRSERAARGSVYFLTMSGHATRAVRVWLQCTAAQMCRLYNAQHRPGVPGVSYTAMDVLGNTSLLPSSRADRMLPSSSRSLGGSGRPGRRLADRLLRTGPSRLCISWAGGLGRLQGRPLLTNSASLPGGKQTPTRRRRSPCGLFFHSKGGGRGLRLQVNWSPWFALSREMETRQFASP